MTEPAPLFSARNERGRVDPHGHVPARDGRSAAWMALGWSAIAGRPGRVVATAAFDADLARLVSAGASLPLQIAGPDREPGPEPAPRPARPEDAVCAWEPAPLREWASLDERPIRCERLAADLAATLPGHAILCVDDPALLHIAAPAVFPAARILSGLCAGSKGAAIAWAVGAKAAAPERTVVALTDAAGFAVGGMDVHAAARAGLPVAVVVANDERDADGRVAAFEQVAVIAGGHGEPVRDPARLALHLRNAMTVTIPTVINVAVRPLSVASFASAAPT